MTLFQNNFERYEKKYLLTKTQYKMLRELTSIRLTEDSYGQHTICNLYLDTDDYALIRTSLEKPTYKEKLRLRSYGVPSGEDPVFLELKKKCSGIVYKRRTALTLAQARQYLNQGDAPETGGQILREIDWAMGLYRPKIKVFLAYDRVALFGTEDSELRVTFDQNIRWRDTMLELSKGDWGAPVLESERVLMEIKLLGAMPLWLSHLLSQLEIYPTPFSKYGACYQNFLRQELGGVLCA